MFAVVQSENNGIFVVPTTWMYDDDGKSFTFYPPKKIKNDQKLVKNMEEPSVNWDALEIVVLKTEISNFSLAMASMKTRLYHNDTSSEVEKMKEKRMPKRRKMSSSSEDDMNSLFDAASEKCNKKSKLSGEKVVRTDKVDTHEQTRVKVIPSTSKDVTNSYTKIQKRNNYAEQKKFEPKPAENPRHVHEGFQNNSDSLTSSTSDSTSGSTSDSNEEQFKSQNENENQRINREKYQDNMYLDSMEFEGALSSTKFNHDETNAARLERLEDNVNTILKNQSLILQHLERIAVQGFNSVAAPSVHISTVELKSISPISDENTFKELEKKLENYLKEPNKDEEFVKKRALMVNYYKKRIRAVGTAAPKNSLMSSLIEIYFESKFIDKTCWQETNGRYSVKNAIGHFDLFFDIIEAHLPGTYSSAADASTAVKTYLHRRRENQAKLLKLTNQNQLYGEENQKNDQ